MILTEFRFEIISNLKYFRCVTFRYLQLVVTALHLQKFNLEFEDFYLLIGVAEYQNILLYNSFREFAYVAVVRIKNMNVVLIPLLYKFRLFSSYFEAFLSSRQL